MDKQIIYGGKIPSFVNSRETTLFVFLSFGKDKRGKVLFLPAVEGFSAKDVEPGDYVDVVLKKTDSAYCVETITRISVDDPWFFNDDPIWK